MTAAEDLFAALAAIRERDEAQQPEVLPDDDMAVARRGSLSFVFVPPEVQ